MSRFAASGLKFKVFVKEQNGDDLSENVDKTKFFIGSPLTGNKAKEFYEGILKEPSSSKGERLSVKPKSKPKQPASNKKQFKNSDLLQLAQNNDVKNLKVFFSQNQDYDVNVVDDFGWTPLMCACCSGAEDAVGILLEKGADPNICDRFGNTALKLSKSKNWRRIIDMLDYCKTDDIDNNDEQIEESPKPFFCPTCKENFTVNKITHDTSTLHLFNCKIKTSTFYGIPECNKGFQLLLKRGWDKEKGLGRDGTGRKFPIKAKIKKDKLGIGAHPPENRREAPHTEKYESKRRKLYKKWKEKDFEKNFRLEFS